MRNDRPVRGFGVIKMLEEVFQSIGEEMHSTSRILGEKSRDTRLSKETQDSKPDETGRFLPY